MSDECKFYSLFNLKSIQLYGGDGIKHNACISSEWSQSEKVLLDVCTFSFEVYYFHIRTMRERNKCYACLCG